MNQAVKTEQIERAEKQKKAQREFFVISRKSWEYLYGIGASFNEMASYLVLACGTGPDHRTTSWSAGAIYQYAGISPKAATKAIMRLELCKAIEIKKPAQKSKFPSYKIHFYDNPKKDPEGDNIFIPSGVVKGVNGEDSPLKRLVNYQNMELLYLFIRLYAFQDKSIDCIDPELVSSALNSSEGILLESIYNEGGFLEVYNIREDELVESAKVTSGFYEFVDARSKEYDFSEDPFFYDYVDSEGEYQEKRGVWGFFSHLRKLGLIQPAYYVCRGDYSEVDAMDVICEIEDQQQLNFLQAVADINKLKGGGGFVYDMDYLWKNPDSGYKHLILASKYKKVHVHKVYKMTYRTPHGASRFFYANQFKYVNEVKLLLGKINQAYEK